MRKRVGWIIAVWFGLAVIVCGLRFAIPGDVARLKEQAHLFMKQGCFAEAEPLYRQVLELMEKRQGAEHRSTGACLNNLGEVYYFLGRYEEAEPLCRRALTIVVWLEYG